MPILDYVAAFFVGVCLCNAIPHLAAGLRGESFASPFGKPPGKGLSSPLTNVLWGTLNLLVAALLYAHEPFSLGFTIPTGLFFLGFVLIGCQLALHFGAVRSGTKEQRTIH